MGLFILLLPLLLPDSNTICTYDSSLVTPTDGVITQINTENTDCLEIDYSVYADHQMFLDMGSSEQAVYDLVDSLVSSVNGWMYFNGQDSYQLKLNLTGVTVSTSPSQDYWNDSIPTSIYELLSNFSSWSSTGGITQTHDVASLWTGTDYSGNVVGSAWVGAVCKYYRYNVLEYFSIDYGLLTNLVAHELGHNLGASHDNALGYVMSPAVSYASAWSQQSDDDITDYVNSINCLDSCDESIVIDPCDTITVPITDTLYDTTIIPVTIFDTTVVPITVFDTNYILVELDDTIITLVFDTTYQIDTLHETVVVQDTIYIVDTIYETIILYDTIYITDTVDIITSGPIDAFRVIDSKKSGIYDMLGREVRDLYGREGYFIIDGKLRYIHRVY